MLLFHTVDIYDQHFKNPILPGIIVHWTLFTSKKLGIYTWGIEVHCYQRNSVTYLNNVIKQTPSY